MTGPYVPSWPDEPIYRNGRETGPGRSGPVATVYVAPAAEASPARRLARIARGEGGEGIARPAAPAAGRQQPPAAAAAELPSAAHEGTDEALAASLRSTIRIIPDFPRSGERFPDVTPLFQAPELLRRVVHVLAREAEARGAEGIAGIDPRGILLGPLVALHLDLPFVPIAAPGTLAGRIRTAERRGAAAVPLRLAIHRDRVKPGQRLVLVDDLLVTGGTATTAAGLVEELGGIVAGVLFLAEDPDAEGRRALGRYNVFSMLQLQEITSERI